MKKLITRTAIIVSMSLCATSCMPTYPKEQLPEAVKTVCKAEYNMEVEAVVVGSTLGIFYPMKGLLDVGMGISEEAWDKISNLILIASRVVLSTDADIKFYCVVTQDERLPELQVVIIKYVDDVKLGMYRNISRDESFKRTFFSINLTPQAKKERFIEQIFDKLKIEDNTRESVMKEFFRSPPTKLTDIGYWRGTFFLKDVNMGEFLAAQISNRIKLDFRREKDLSTLFDYMSSEGVFSSEDNANTFLVKFKIADQYEGSEEENPRVKKIQEILRIANEVVSGYQFRDFDYLILEDQLANAKLSVSSEDIFDFSRKRLPVRDVAHTTGNYFGAIQ